jgi:hypothetical protein
MPLIGPPWVLPNVSAHQARAPLCSSLYCRCFRREVIYEGTQETSAELLTCLVRVKFMIRIAADPKGNYVHPTPTQERFQLRPLGVGMFRYVCTEQTTDSSRLPFKPQMAAQG